MAGGEKGTFLLVAGEPLVLCLLRAMGCQSGWTPERAVGR